MHMLKKIKMENNFYSNGTGWANVSSLPGDKDISVGKTVCRLLLMGTSQDAGRWELRSRTDPCSLRSSAYSHSSLIHFQELIKAIGLARMKW